MLSLPRVTPCIIAAALALGARAGETPPPALDTLEQLRSLAGQWEADLPGFGKIANTIREVSNGTAVEETIGTPGDNETSIYTRDGDRILLTHFCALTPGGHVVRLATQPLQSRPRQLEFAFVGASNLAGIDAPHMRRVLTTFGDVDHFSEAWTKTEGGKDTVFELRFVRRSTVAQPALANDELTARNKAVVQDFYTTVLIGRDVDAAPRFLRADYIQHNPQVPTGLKGFMDAFRERFAQKLPPDYKRELLRVIGEDDIVVIYVRQLWTGRDGQHHEALGFDMFRVQDGKIAEHWDAD